jgi:hypothetical protein
MGSICKQPTKSVSHPFIMLAEQMEQFKSQNKERHIEATSNICKQRINLAFSTCSGQSSITSLRLNLAYESKCAARNRHGSNFSYHCIQVLKTGTSPTLLLSTLKIQAVYSSETTVPHILD